jgi:DNA-directed RNA polymerase subunit RPC12/RpoP
MSTICPRCGKENTSMFSDSVYKTHGFFCEDCKKDFFVDDGKTIAEHEKHLTDFFYQHTNKDGVTYRIYIQQVGNKVTLAPSMIKNKMMIPYEKMDITPMWDELKRVLFEKMFILDWDKQLTGFLTGKNDESYKIEMKYSLAVYPDVSYEGRNKFPPYFKVLEQLFANFFATE